ncbi:hypothetical protein HYALB_00012741 [Hymenoscyphus albidus]|uniref:SUZ-C domain-containing protein n=1 Tax=Hymenoscyphus albidus TaxID=595503 RepID=A0A9N9LWF9_9HELO|nr:hypothetical protein HYALB_00012741 [Hymenoscyphus albidus]
MVKKAAIPDAWDDDWESLADKEAGGVQLTQPPEEEVKISKAERLARHAETNKKIWQSAEEPETFHYLAAHDNVPLKTEFKPALKVLSRKPTPKAVQKIDPVTGLAKLTLEDEDDEEDEVKNRPSPEELRLKAQKEREEKQKRYDEVRARIMGTSGTSSLSSGVVTPPTSSEGNRNRGKGRGGLRQEAARPTSQSGRPVSQSSSKELYDPDYTSKPGVAMQKRSGEGSRTERSTPRDEEQIIRSPKGPDGAGRGFGFARGGKKS